MEIGKSVRNLSIAVAVTLATILTTFGSVGTASAQAMPSVVIDPSRAPAGASITFTGSGFALGEMVQADFGGLTLFYEIAVNGTFQAQATLPSDIPEGFHPMEIYGDMSWFELEYEITAPVAPAYVPSPAAQVDPSQAYSGDSVTVTGTGFDLGEAVEVHFAGVTIANAVAVGGDFQVTATLPMMVPAGAHPMDFDGNMGASITLSYTILAPVYVPSPAVQVDPSQAYSGDVVSITGSGFGQGEVVEVNFAGVTIANAIAVRDAMDPDGKFQVTATLPTMVPAGAHPMDIDGNMGSSVTLSYPILAPVAVATPTPTVVPAYVPNPSVQVDPSQSYAGDSVTITGTGFDLGEKVEVEFAGVTIANAVAVGGDFQVTATLPTMVPEGPHPMDFNGDMGSSVVLSYTILAPMVIATPTPTVPPPAYVPSPAVQVDPSQAYSGDKVTIVGTGFDLGEVVEVGFAGVIIAKVVAVNGDFQVTPTLPKMVPAGAHPMDIDGSMGSSVNVSYTILAPAVIATPTPVATAVPVISNPAAIVATPPLATPGSEIVVEGTDFQSGETVTLYFDGDVAGALLTGDGYFTFKFTVPSDKGSGIYNVQAIGDLGSQALIPFMVLPRAAVVLNPTITASPADAAPGSDVTISGSDFADDELVQIRFGTLTRAVVTANGGTFEVTVTLPEDVPAGTYPVIAEGDSASTASAAISILDVVIVGTSAEIAIEPASTLPGTEVVVTGSGFAQGETVELSISGAVVATIVAADGTFVVDLTIPASADPFEYQISVVGDMGSQAQGFLTVVAAQQTVVTPSVEVVPSSASAGERVNLRGSGFLPGEIVEVVLGRVKLDEAVAMDGVFQISLELPEDIPAGTYSLEALGNLGSSSTVSLNIVETVRADPGISVTTPPSEPARLVEPLRALNETTITSAASQNEVVTLEIAQPAVADVEVAPVELQLPEQPQLSQLTAGGPEAVETTDHGTLAAPVPSNNSSSGMVLIAGAAGGAFGALALGLAVLLRARFRRSMPFLARA